MKWYVSTLSTYVIVDAPSESEAIRIGTDELRKMLGRVPQIKLVRKATAEEVEDMDWHNSQQFSDSPSVIDSLRSRHPKAFEAGPNKAAVNATTQLSDAPVQLADNVGKCLSAIRQAKQSIWDALDNSKGMSAVTENLNKAMKLIDAAGVAAAESRQLSDAPVQLADAEFEFKSSYAADQFLQRIRSGRPDVAAKKNGHYVECSFSDKDAEFVFEQAKKLGGEF